MTSETAVQGERAARSETGAAEGRVDPGLSRSWLLVNGASGAAAFDRAQRSRSDQIVLDIEDAVDPTQKPDARIAVTSWLADAAHTAWVRVNDRSTSFWSDDLSALVGLPGLLGVMLAKTESAGQVTETYDQLDGSVRVLPLVESAIGIENAIDIAQARGAFRLAFGSGDYRRDTGTSSHDLAMAYPRSRLVVASRIGNLPGPIDGPTVGTNHGVLREQSALAVALGLTGKLCLDSDQLPVINEVISPTASDIAWACDFLADFEARGQKVRDGSDPPRLARARKIQTLATAFGERL